MGPDDPPIVVAAQTNHALDQLLNHILKFEPNIVRLGSRCGKANQAILKCTLYELRTNNPSFPDGSKGLKSASLDYRKHVDSIQSALESITTDSLLTAETLRKHRLITDVQLESLRGFVGWEGEDESKGDIADCKIRHEQC
jgi:helicase required for RNAi-mediated heterochromatin assembly 1